MNKQDQISDGRIKMMLKRNEELRSALKKLLDKMTHSSNPGEKKKASKESGM